MEVVEAALACRRSVGLMPLHHLRVRDQGSLWKARCVFIERRVGSMTMCAVESAGLRIVTARYRSVRCLFVCVGIHISISVTARPWLDFSLMKVIAGN